MNASEHEHDDVQRRVRALEKALAEAKAQLADRQAADTHSVMAATSREADFAVIMTDLEGMICGWSKSAERVLGWTGEQAMGQSIDLCFTPEDRAIDRSGEEMRLARLHGRASDERWHLRADGSRFWASGKLTLLTNDEREVCGFVKVLRDRTEQHDAGIRLADGEARYRTLLDMLNQGFCIIEIKYAPDGAPIDYRFIEVNDAFLRQTGLADVTGKWMRQIAPNHEQYWFNIYGEVARSREMIRFEHRAEALGRWYEVQALPIGRPELHQVAVLFNDISARRQAEADLLNLELKLGEEVAARTSDQNQLWELSTDIMLRCRPSGEIVAVNPAWVTTLGWSEAELLGSDLFDLVHPDDLERTHAGAARAAEGATLWRFENRYRTKNGDYRWIEWSTQTLDTLINAVGRDVTDDKENAEALKRMEAQLRQSQKMEAVGQLTGGLAHDFNNLLTGVTGSLELLQVRILQGRIGEIDRYINAAQDAAKRATTLTQRLLAFSRQQTLDPKPTDVNRLVLSMEELIRRTVGPAITVEVTTAIHLWTALVDVSQLENALLNLCINARDAMPEGGLLSIKTANLWFDERSAAQADITPGQYLSLSVSDTGTGMSAEVIEKAFEPFFTTKPIGMGTGLGLSMIYGFVKQSAGHVRIHSEIDHGTTVHLYLPRHHGATEVVEETADLANAPHALENETVLVVDDEPTIRMLISEVLDDLDYRAVEAANGAAALAVLHSTARIDLLVTDVGLPDGMSGRQIADTARLARPDLKVLFITGYEESVVLNQGHLPPGMYVLTKPFTMQALASKIRMFIGTGSEQP